MDTLPFTKSSMTTLIPDGDVEYFFEKARTAFFGAGFSDDEIKNARIHFRIRPEKNYSTWVYATARKVSGEEWQWRDCVCEPDNRSARKLGRH